mmetsp:Transcript_15820/g.36891  ORF Transcript_15820/g.36891 Transcript_15820/m.36891 type:complete len:114 (-) Transcript_15820:1758-2099(-)
MAPHASPLPKLTFLRLPAAATCQAGPHVLSSPCSKTTIDNTPRLSDNHTHTSQGNPYSAILSHARTPRRAYMRKTPNLVGGDGFSRAAAKAKPSVSRVLVGSITPSSHRRADE